MDIYQILSDYLYSDKSYAGDIESFWNMLTRAQKVVLEKRIINSLTLEETGKLFEKPITKEAVRQHQNAALAKLKKLIANKYKFQKIL